MNQKLRYLCILLALVVVTASFAACGTGDNKQSSAGTGSSAASESSEQESSSTETESLNYSEGLDENGKWEGVTAKDYVEKLDVKGMKVPAGDVAVTDDNVQQQVETELSALSTTAQVKDRAVVNGDSVNIDYVGSVDGVAFSGGDTAGAGADVTAGATNYIDDFLEQLIGHTPGESFDINVTFPDVYENNPDLAGKDAVFATTINYITETTTPELTDALVAENFAESKGWNTVAEMKAGIRTELERTKLEAYFENYLRTEVTVKSVPEIIVTQQEKMILDYYKQYADYSGMEVEEFLSSYVGVATEEELIASNKEQNTQTATFYLLVQAIAEDAGINISEEDVQAYFTELGNADISAYKEMYGMPYLKQGVMCQLVLDYLCENVVLTEAESSAS